MEAQHHHNLHRGPIGPMQSEASYLGTNTRGVKTVNLGENDSRVLEMRRMR